MTRDELLAVVEAVKEWVERNKPFGGGDSANNEIHATMDEADRLDRILSNTPKVVASEITQIGSDGTPGWCEAVACWPSSDIGSDIGKEVRVIAVEVNDGD